MQVTELSQFQPGDTAVTIALKIFVDRTASVGTRRYQQAFIWMITSLIPWIPHCEERHEPHTTGGTMVDVGLAVSLGIRSPFSDVLFSFVFRDH